VARCVDARGKQGLQGPTRLCTVHTHSAALRPEPCRRPERPDRPPNRTDRQRTLGMPNSSARGTGLRNPTSLVVQLHNFSVPPERDPGIEIVFLPSPELATVFPGSVLPPDSLRILYTCILRRISNPNHFFCVPIFILYFLLSRRLPLRVFGLSLSKFGRLYLVHLLHHHLLLLLRPCLCQPTTSSPPPTTNRRE